MKSAKKILAALLSVALIAGVLSTGLLVGNAQDETTITKEKQWEITREAASEGMVLLKNDAVEGKEVLPVPAGQKLALFGNAQAGMIVAGEGSGSVKPDYIHSPLYGLLDKEEDGKVDLYDPLVKAYTKINITPGTPETRITQTMADDAAKECDTAVFFVGRQSSESADRTLKAGDYYLSTKEKELLGIINKAGFKKVVAVMNICGIIDMQWIEEYGIDSALISWIAGADGGMAVADILCGDVNPSGKLADTFAKNYEDYPSASTFSESEAFVNYEEDIFVGYRYFETFDPNYEKVAYEFGFGLSYTDFTIGDVNVTNDAKNVKVTAKVTNSGTRAGKEVVQVYYGAPQGKLGNPAKELAAYEKTKLLNPGESQDITLTFAINDMASFDDLGKTGNKSAYVLEAGDYNIYVGNSVKDAGKNGVRGKYTATALTVTEQLTQKAAPTTSFKRLLANGNYETLAGDYKMPAKTPAADIASKPLSEVATLSDVKSGKVSMEDFLGQLTVPELASLTFGKPGIMTGSIGDIEKYGIPYAETNDGPAGVRLAVATTSLPSEMLLACTWNKELVEKVGQVAGADAKANGIQMILTPGANIHRNPLCGRNYEYLSEDPYVTGTMAAAIIRGIQSQNVAASLKHFAVNNKETGRYTSDSRVSERALREIYLEGFQMAVTAADPWTVMSSYNKINGTYAGENKDLLTGILRGEWGFKNVIVTDWGAYANAVGEILAGGDLRMPEGDASALISAVNSGTLSRQNLENSVAHILEMIMKTNAMDNKVSPYKTILKNDSVAKLKAYYAQNVTEAQYRKFDLVTDYDAGKFFKNITTSSSYEYTLIVEDAGEYQIQARLSTITANSGVKLTLDTKELGTLSLEKATSQFLGSGWTTTAPLKVTLEPGAYKLRVNYTAANVALNYLTFTPSALYNAEDKTLNDLKGLMAKQFELKQKNYTSASWNTFISAITAARAINEASLGADITKAYNDLDAAITGLVEGSDPIPTETTTEPTTTETTTTEATTTTTEATTTTTETTTTASETTASSTTTTTETSTSKATTTSSSATTTTQTSTGTTASKTTTTKPTTAKPTTQTEPVTTEVDTTTVVETEAPTTADSGRGNNPNTGAAAPIGIVLLMGAAAGAIVLSKKKK